MKIVTNSPLGKCDICVRLEKAKTKLATKKDRRKWIESSREHFRSVIKEKDANSLYKYEM